MKLLSQATIFGVIFFGMSNIANAQLSSLYDQLLRDTVINCVDDVQYDRTVKARAEGFAVWEVGRHIYTVECHRTALKSMLKEVESSSSQKTGDDGSAPSAGNQPNPNPQCNEGSIIRVDTRTLEERLQIAGTPYFLRYTTSKMPGSKSGRSIKIPLSDSSSEVLGYTVEGTYGNGRTFGGSYLNTPNQFHHFTWDGKDNLGNYIPNTLVDFNVIYHLDNGFEDVEVNYKTQLAGLNENYQNIGGWALENHHYYDFLKGMIFFGHGGVFKTQAINQNGEYRATSDDGSEIYYFNSNGLHLRTVNGFMGTTKYTFEYDPTWNKLSKITNAVGEETTFTINSGNGTITSVMSPKGLVTVINYDSNGYLSQLINPAGEDYLMTYTEDGLLETFEKPEGEVSTFTYDSKGDLESDTHSGGHSTTLASGNDNTGYPIKYVTYTSTMGRVGTRFFNNAYQSNDQGNANTDDIKAGSMSLRYELGSRTEKWDSHSETISFKTDPRNSRSRYAGKVTTQIGNKTFSISNSRAVNVQGPTYPYNPELMTYTTNVDGAISTSVYDGKTRTWTSTSAEGRKSSSSLDQFERIIGSKVANLLPTSIQYQSLNNISKIVQGNRITSLGYDKWDYLSEVVNPLGEITKYKNDEMGRVLTKIDPDNRATKYTYDENGRMTSLTTPNGKTHQFVYNGQELLSEYIPPAIPDQYVKTTYAYNNDKQLTNIFFPDGRSIEYDYNTDGRLNFYGYESEGYKFIGWGPRTGTDYPEFITKSGAVKLKKDYFGPYLKSEEQTTDDTDATIAKVEFGFDNQFRISKVIIKDSAGGVVHVPYYLYDKDSLIVQAGELAIKRDQELGYPVEQKIGKAQVIHQYDKDYGELSRIEYRYKGKTDLLSTFKRDKLGRISEINSKEGQLSLFYDRSGRYKGKGYVGTGKPFSQFFYDKNGNRVKGYENGQSFTAQFDDHDRLIQYNDTTFSYNLNGDMESRTTGSETISYVYDVFGNLTSVTMPDKTISYLVDGHDRRVAKLVDSTVVTRYIWQSQYRLAAELNPDGTLRKQFVYADGVNSPEYMIYQGKRYMFVKDHRGSVNLVVDVDSGNIEQKIEYSEFGEVLSDTNPGFQPFGFAGGLYDPDTKLVRFGARDYDGKLGRWLAKDPIRFNGGDENLYGYVLNDPVNLVDINGLSILGAIADFAGGIGAETNGGAVGSIIGGGIGFIVGGGIGGAIVGGLVGEFIGDWLSGPSMDPDADDPMNPKFDPFNPDPNLIPPIIPPLKSPPNSPNMCTPG